LVFITFLIPLYILQMLVEILGLRVAGQERNVDFQVADPAARQREIEVELGEIEDKFAASDSEGLRDTAW